MNFIGPRPLPEYCFNSKILKRYFHERHSCRPGLTGLSQAKGKGTKRSHEAKLIYDIYYVRNRSMKLDLLILLQTAIALLNRMLNNKHGISL